MKIGIILDSLKVPWYIYDLVDWIKKRPNLDLEVLIIQNIDNNNSNRYGIINNKMKFDFIL